MKHFSIALFVLGQALAGCGADAPTALTGTTSAALSCRTDSDCSTGHRCAGPAQHAYCEPAPGQQKAGGACDSDRDCGAEFVCAHDVVSPYCRPRPATPSAPAEQDAGCGAVHDHDEDHSHEDDDYPYSAPSRCAGTDAGTFCAQNGAPPAGDYYDSDGHGDGHGSDDGDGHDGRRGRD